MPCVGLSALLIANLALPPLAPKKYSPLPVGSVTPTGWLLTQLQLQADGLSGHLAQFWPDVQKSVWIGGGGDGGLHERTPYWLNGIVPLAFLLRNAGRAKPVRAATANVCVNVVERAVWACVGCRL